MVIVNGTTISMVRGDTAKIEIAINDSEGHEYAPVEGDVIRFAAKKSYYDEEPIIYKLIPNDTLLLWIEPQDTKNLPFGKYIYDIEITFADGDVDTFIANATLEILKEVF